MGTGPQYTIAQLNEDGVPVPISADNPLKISGGSGGGAVVSVNGQTGEVELDAADIGAVTEEYVDLRVPVPPVSGSYTLQSVDGVTSWVEN